MSMSRRPFQMKSQGLFALIAFLAFTIAAASFFVFEPKIALVSCLLGWTMLSIAVVDARRFIVPDILSLPSIPGGLLVARLLDDGHDLRGDHDHLVANHHGVAERDELLPFLILHRHGVDGANVRSANVFRQGWLIHGQHCSPPARAGQPS